MTTEQLEELKRLAEAAFDNTTSHAIFCAAANPSAILSLLQQLDEAQAENERLRKDADRYRWLRGQHWSESNMCVVMHPKNAVRLGHECPSVECLDAYIDAALAKEPK